MIQSRIYRLCARYAWLLPLAVLGAGCQASRNFITYYNLFYNIERLDEEVANEVGYSREQKQQAPTYYIPYDETGRRGERFYPHLERFVLSPDEMRANRSKIDSMIIKGSKLLARNAKSDYVDGALYYIAKAYFYQREWFLCQKKCEELINAFPQSKYSPDTHLLLAMAMLKQENPVGGQNMLSRAIDIAWAQQRQDVLMDAFRLNADVALAEGDLDKAMKPYQRAILLSTSSEDKARWQYELGLAFFRNGNFQRAATELENVERYSPDLITKFQAQVQLAVALRVLGRYDDAGKVLAALRSNQNYEPWYGLVDIEAVNLAADRTGTQPDDKALQRIDSLYPGKYYPAYSVYEHGLRAFRAGRYQQALGNFRALQSARVPFQKRAQYYTGQLTTYFDQLGVVQEQTKIAGMNYTDSTRLIIADAYYNVARVFVKLDNEDSLRKYYDLSSQWAPAGTNTAARALYARSVMIRAGGNAAQADSLLEVLVKDYPLTDYAAEARPRLGYTMYASRDSARDAYQSGLSFMKVGEYDRAVGQLRFVITQYPLTAYVPQAYYALGLIYEQKLENLDSAYEYYAALVDGYPTSEQAAGARPFVNARRAKMNLPPHSGGVGAGTDTASASKNAGQSADDEKLVPLGSPNDGKPMSAIIESLNRPALSPLKPADTVSKKNPLAIPPPGTAPPIIPTGTPGTGTPALPPPGTAPPLNPVRPGTASDKPVVVPPPNKPKPKPR